jgi:transposase InsO family protein
LRSPARNAATRPSTAAHAKGSRGGRPPAFDPDLYADRNVVERCFNRLKQFRDLATRYAKRAAYYRAEIIRILRERGEVRERRRQATDPPRVKPELIATAPNHCLSWDITNLRGRGKWTFYHLYVIIDIFSGYVPGWLIAERDSAALAERLLAETITKHQIARDPPRVGRTGPTNALRRERRQPLRHPPPSRRRTRLSKINQDLAMPVGVDPRGGRGVQACPQPCSRP